MTLMLVHICESNAHKQFLRYPIMNCNILDYFSAQIGDKKLKQAKHNRALCLGFISDMVGQV